MPEFGERSRKNLAQAHPSLQLVLNEVVKITDCAVICGHRGEAEQEAAFHAGTSQKRWPESKHNKIPSLAVDVVPSPIDWKDSDRMFFLAGVIVAVAHRMGVKLRWGGDWDSDGDFKDQKFHDRPHFELI
jgi:hypothetical protein